MKRLIKLFTFACFLLLAYTAVQAQSSSGSTIVLSDNSTLSGTGWNKSGNVFYIRSGNVTVTGTTTTNCVVIPDGAIDVHVTLNSASIDVSDRSECAFAIFVPGVGITITLVGNNTFKSGGSYAGLFLPADSWLQIYGGVNDRLTVTSGHNAAGIGGDNGIYSDHGGGLIVYGGNITATAINNGSGIGGGFSGGCGHFEIHGGSVTAISQGDGNGIGPGALFAVGGVGGGSFEMYGGSVTAISQNIHGLALDLSTDN